MAVLIAAFSRHTQWEVQLPHPLRGRGQNRINTWYGQLGNIIRSAGVLLYKPKYNSTFGHAVLSQVSTTEKQATKSRWYGDRAFWNIITECLRPHNGRQLFWIICRMWCRTYRHPTSAHGSKTVRCWDYYWWLVLFANCLLSKGRRWLGKDTALLTLHATLFRELRMSTLKLKFTTKVLAVEYRKLAQTRW